MNEEDRQKTGQAMQALALTAAEVKALTAAAESEAKAEAQRMSELAAKGRGVVRLHCGVPHADRVRREERPHDHLLGRLIIVQDGVLLEMAHDGHSHGDLSKTWTTYDWMKRSGGGAVDFVLTGQVWLTCPKHGRGVVTREEMESALSAGRRRPRNSPAVLFVLCAPGARSMMKRGDWPALRRIIGTGPSS